MKRNVDIKSMKYEDFNDNEYIEQMLKELRENGTNVIVGCLDNVIEYIFGWTHDHLFSFVIPKERIYFNGRRCLCE